MAERRRKAAARREAKLVYFDEGTIEPPKPTGCTVEGCGRKHKARGLCEAHYKHRRRAQGLNN